MYSFIHTLLYFKKEWRRIYKIWYKGIRKNKTLIKSYTTQLHPTPPPATNFESVKIWVRIFSHNTDCSVYQSTGQVDSRLYVNFAVSKVFSDASVLTRERSDYLVENPK